MILLDCEHLIEEYPEAKIGQKVYCEECEAESIIVALISWGSDEQESQ